MISLKRRRSLSIWTDGSSPNAQPTHDPSLPAGGSYCSRTRTLVPAPLGSKCTDPAVTTLEPSIDRHPIRRSGMSLIISASHSTVAPRGAVATQRERRSSSTVTDCRCSIARGKLSSLRQNAYSSDGDRFTVTSDSTLTPPGPERARFVLVSSAVEIPAAAYAGQCAVLAL